MRVGIALAFCAAGLGLAAVALRRRTEAVTEAADDASEWHLLAQAIDARAFSAIQYIHQRSRPAYTH